MKIGIVIIVAAMIALSFQTNAVAEDREYDPLQRNLVLVGGQADIMVPTNMFKLTFDFDIQRGSFSEASAESEQIIKMITREVESLKLPQVEIIKGWDFIKQATISIGQSGKKVSNRLTIKVTNFPEGKMHELIARIIDNCLEVNKDIYFKEIEAGVSEDVENQKREDVLMAALRNLKSNAEKAAQTQGGKVIAAKRIFITGEQDGAQEGVMMNKMRYDYAESKSLASMERSVSIQKGFAVRSQISDHVKITANVAGIYEIQ